MDLAEELALNGIVTLIFYYRGAWGSEGTYRFSGMVPSTIDALKYLKGLTYVDPNRVGLVSHSMGAVPLCSVMSRDKSIKTGAMISPVADTSMWLGPGVIDNVFTILTRMAHGKLAYGDESEYKADIVEFASKLNPLKKVGEIEAPLLFIAGSADNVTPPETYRELYEKASEPKRWVLMENADHGFSEHRIPLQREVLRWLREHL